MTCAECCLPKTLMNCGICSESICKDCTRFLETSAFSFFAEIPEKLTHKLFCSNCYDKNIAPALTLYGELMKRAKDVFIFYKPKRNRVPVLRTSNKNVQVKDCVDREESVLRLAFLAAEQGYNGLVRVEINSTKIRNAGYQKTHWGCTGIPVQVDPARL